MARWLGLLLATLAVLGCSTSVHSPAPTSTSPATSAPTDAPPSCACATAQPTESGSPDPSTVLLRMATFGGLPYPGITVQDPPDYTLYGDGHVIYTEDQTADNVHQVQLWHARLTPDQVAELLSFALDTAGLRSARERYEDMPIFDVGSTIFEIHADGVDKSVFIYALGDFGIPDPPDAAARAAFLELKKRLVTVGSRVRSGEIEGLGAYQPERYLVTLAKAWTELPVTAEWPWPDLTLDDFGSTGDQYIDYMPPQRVKPLLDLGIHQDLVVTAPGGENLVVTIRPMVPGDSAL